MCNSRDTYIAFDTSALHDFFIKKTLAPNITKLNQIINAFKKVKVMQQFQGLANWSWAILKHYMLKRRD